jgi:hypothetical protein
MTALPHRQDEPTELGMPPFHPTEPFEAIGAKVGCGAGRALPDAKLSDREGSRLWENVCEPSKRRTVFSIGFFR